MSAFVRKLAIASLVFGTGGVANADWPWWHKAHVDYQRNNTWPQPFRSMDANAVQEPFEVMKNNGWRAYNTISTQLFHPDDHSLTDSGRLRVNWIVTQAPTARRVIFVLKGQTAEETAARVESVQLAVSEIVPVGELPQILVTEVDPYRASGQYQTAISRSMMGSIPKPRLPAFGGMSNPSAGAQNSGAPPAPTN